MLRNDPKITAIMHDSLVKAFATEHKISLDESKKEISNMSFMQYHKLLEAGANIVPPSGNTIGPNAGSQSTNSAQSPAAPQQAGSQPAQSAPSQNRQILWKGQGSPVEMGMTVGLAGQNGAQEPGEITNIDQAKNGVTIKNTKTGQEELHGMDDLQPYSQDDRQNAPQQQMAEELARMKKLAGIAEDASGGASCAGAMGASTAQPLGKIKRRQPVSELKQEYTPTVAKTVVGDTKPSQASGKLSADLAASGKKTAARTNNGLRK